MIYKDPGLSYGPFISASTPLNGAYVGAGASPLQQGSYLGTSPSQNGAYLGASLSNGGYLASPSPNGATHLGASPSPNDAYLEIPPLPSGSYLGVSPSHNVPIVGTSPSYQMSPGGSPSLNHVHADNTGSINISLGATGGLAPELAAFSNNFPGTSSSTGIASTISANSSAFISTLPVNFKAGDEQVGLKTESSPLVQSNGNLFPSSQNCISPNDSAVLDTNTTTLNHDMYSDVKHNSPFYSNRDYQKIFPSDYLMSYQKNSSSPSIGISKLAKPSNYMMLRTLELQETI